VQFFAAHNSSVLHALVHAYTFLRAQNGYFMVLCILHCSYTLLMSFLKQCSPKMCSFQPLTPPCAACPAAGQDAWLNPVEPKLPDDYTPGELHLASDKAASAAIAAAVAAGLQPPKVIVKAT
jgi:hypothetical protein